MNPESARIEAGSNAVDDSAVNDVLSWLQSAGSPYFSCNIEGLSDTGQGASVDCRDPGLLCRQMTQRFFDNA